MRRLSGRESQEECREEMCEQGKNQKSHGWVTIGIPQGPLAKLLLDRRPEVEMHA